MSIAEAGLLAADYRRFHAQVDRDAAMLRSGRQVAGASPLTRRGLLAAAGATTLAARLGTGPAAAQDRPAPGGLPALSIAARSPWMVN